MHYKYSENMTWSKHLPLTLAYENDTKEINIHICMVLDSCGPENGETEIRNEFPGINVNNYQVYLQQQF